MPFGMHPNALFDIVCLSMYNPTLWISQLGIESSAFLLISLSYIVKKMYLMGKELDMFSLGHKYGEVAQSPFNGGHFFWKQR